MRELATVCFIHYEFVPNGRTVNQVYYMEVLKSCVKELDELFDNSCILLLDNATAHTSLSVKEFLATKQITVLEHLPYSPDLAPIDFFLFPKIWKY
jgi:histone-lysine N-methyltransferase SETMAR